MLTLIIGILGGFIAGWFLKDRVIKKRRTKLLKSIENLPPLE